MNKKSKKLFERVLAFSFYFIIFINLLLYICITVLSVINKDYLQVLAQSGMFWLCLIICTFLLLILGLVFMFDEEDDYYKYVVVEKDILEKLKKDNYKLLKENNNLKRKFKLLFM